VLRAAGRGGTLMFDALYNAFTAVQAWIFEAIVQPLFFELGLMAYVEPAYEGVEVFLIGLIEIGMMYALLRPLEAWRPAEVWHDRRAVRVDVLYTFLNRLGIAPLAVFLLLQPLVDTVDGTLRLQGYIPPSLEDLLPWLADHPLASFFIYLAILDLAEYWRHRLSHRYNWWWALHAVHHSQRQLSLWSDRRNHILDDLLGDLWIVLVALLIGVPPGQFIGIVVVTRFIESLSHTNVRLSFGRLGDRLLVSPSFHRTHHGIGVGHEGRAMGCNFAPLFPLWDMLFGTANFTRAFPATGIRDQLQGVDYGKGIIAQHVLGAKNLWQALKRRKPQSA
jgi:sterol desaturase/sphingolipid hydroxylase (fatty acid hydroxylase superfamily)